MTKPVVVSLVINNFNYGRFLEQSIKSALDQTYPHIEVIVVDDGSTDNSREVIASFGKSVKSVLQKNQGQAAALNAGFAASVGDWICLLDSDDLFNAGKVQRIFDLAQEYPAAGMIAHDLAYCSAAGEPIRFAPPYLQTLTLVDDRPLACRGKMSVSLPATSGLCIRREVAERLLPAPAEMRVGVDNYLKWITLGLFPVLVVPEFLGQQRIHGKNVGTIEFETGGLLGRLRLAKQEARISFFMKKNYPHLTKLAWKQYGRLLYLLLSSGSPEARTIGKDIRSEYSVIESTPACYFYVSAAFLSAFVEHRFRFRSAIRRVSQAEP